MWQAPRARFFRCSPFIGQSRFFTVLYLNFVLIFLEKVREKRAILIFFYAVSLSLSVIVCFLPYHMAVRTLPHPFLPVHPLAELALSFFIIFNITLAIYAVYLLLASYVYIRGISESAKYIVTVTVLGFSFLFAACLTTAVSKFFRLVSTCSPCCFCGGLLHNSPSPAGHKYYFQQGASSLCTFGHNRNFYFASINILQRLGTDTVNPKLVGLLSSVVTVIFAVILFFTPLQKSLSRTIDDLVYRGRYSYQTILEDSARALVTFLDLDQLLNYIVETILKTSQCPNFRFSSQMMKRGSIIWP